MHQEHGAANAPPQLRERNLRRAGIHPGELIMALWDKVKSELDRAGRAAQQAIDEGKLRLEVHRARQLADKYAMRLGYAVYRSRKAGGDLPAEEYAGMSANLANAEAEIARLERLLEEAALHRRAAGDNGATGGTGAPESAPPTP